MLRRRIASGASIVSALTIASPPRGEDIGTQRRGIIMPDQTKAYGAVFRSAEIPLMEVYEKMVPVQTLLAEKENDLRCIDDFAELGLNRQVRHALQAMKVEVPSPIQQRAMKPLAERKNAVISSETGSGKTLAFLAPLYNSMMEDRDVHGVPLREYRPRAIVLCPTTELVLQTAAVAKNLDRSTGLASIGIVRRQRTAGQWKAEYDDQMLDVLITTPSRVLRLIRKRKLYLDDLRHVVFDEADELFQMNRHKEAIALHKIFHRRSCYRHLWPVRTQHIFVTSILTPSLMKYANRSRAITIAHDDVHKIPKRIKHRFHQVPQEREKLDVLRFLLTDKAHNVPTDFGEDNLDGSPHQHKWVPIDIDGNLGPNAQTPQVVDKTRIAIDTREEATRSGESGLPPQTCSSNALTLFESPPPIPSPTFPVFWEHLRSFSAPFTCHIPRRFNEPGKRVIVFFNKHSTLIAIYHKLSQEGYKVAMLHGLMKRHERGEHFGRFASGQCNILLSTDLGARGLDIDVDMVVNWHPAKTTIDYIVRCGRVGRMGRRGVAVTLHREHDKVMINALKFMTAKRLSLEDISVHPGHTSNAEHGAWKRDHKNMLARRFVQLTLLKTIPGKLEKTYLKHNATWRGMYKPEEVGFLHSGIDPRHVQKKNDRAMEVAIWARKEIVATRKGGTSKFGHKGLKHKEFDGAFPRIVDNDTRANISNAVDPDPVGPRSKPPEVRFSPKEME